MLLKELIKDLRYELIGDELLLSKDVSKIVFDSRMVDSNSIFVALKGTLTDGHKHIDEVIAKGVKIIVCEEVGAAISGVLYIKVKNSRYALGLMSCEFYEHPSRQLKLIGVTGTNGKTTVATLLYKLFLSLGHKTALISTVENRINDKILDATHTTPDSLSINMLLAEMRDAECDYVFMEVSSHAADQDRIAGLDFDTAIFTNITHDHLDYHGTFQNYIYAKKKFFDQLSSKAFALINSDDKRADVMVQNCMAKTYRYSLKSLADFKTRIVENNIDGLVLEIDGKEIFTRLSGDFNAYNILAVYSTAILLGEDKDEVLTNISNLIAVEGRFDAIRNEVDDITGIVDYAHTPDALEKTLQTIHKISKGKGNVITVVGCGGDRDKSKRPIMAKIACNYSDQVILTSDNPRSESAQEILEEMVIGVPVSAKMKVLIIEDRRQAIKTACRLAKSGDIILVAGKGHEKYQEIKGVKYPFDDKVELKDELIKTEIPKI